MSHTHYIIAPIKLMYRIYLTLSDGRCFINMKAVLVLIVLTLAGLGECIIKRQSSCINARQFAASTCLGITDFENLFTVSGSTITPFVNVLDRIAERGDSQSVINEICTSQSCFSRLEILYSSCTVHFFVFIKIKIS